MPSKKHRQPRPKVIILGGPNGAGKTTASKRLLTGPFRVKDFVNADAIAQGLSAFDPEKVAITAGRIMLTRLRELAAEGGSFAFETTLASRSFARWIAELRTQGYDFHLFYLWVPSPEFSIRRVELRVKDGGHHVPDETIRRRYLAAVRNFCDLYRPLTTGWRCYNSSIVGEPKLIANGKGANYERIFDKAGAKSSRTGTLRRRRRKTIDQIMSEVGGEIDRAIHLAAREAALRHVRDGRMVPVWENGAVVMKPAAQALAEADAAARKAPRKRSGA